MKKYREKYGMNPDVIAANAYDAMSIISALVSSNIASRENFKQVLSTVRNYEGANGTFSFDMNGDSVRDYYIMQIVKGRVEIAEKRNGRLDEISDVSGEQRTHARPKVFYGNMP